MKFHKFLLTITTLALILSACAPATPSAVMMDKPTEGAMMEATATSATMMSQPTSDAMMASTATPEMMMQDTPTADAMMMHDTPTPDTMMANPTESSMMGTPMWFSASFVNASDSAAFKVDDFKGKVVLVEAMAVWCTNCKAQQDQIKALHTALGMPADLITVSLDIDPNENNDALKAYVAKNGFDWMYAIAPADVSREIGNLYGAQFLNPPSTPLLIIDRKGTAHPLPFGLKSADDLQKALEPYLNGM